MNLLSSPRRRRVLFAALYFSEGAPIGFIWLALPTEMRTAGVPIERITSLTALLVLPWSFKFVWAPLVDVLSTPRFGLRHWILAFQSVMAATLLSVPFLGFEEAYSTLATILFVHAVAAATQDVAIDALCISVTSPEERGSLNGWMQAGMLLGRACMGGGALVLSRHIGFSATVMVLVSCVVASMALVSLSRTAPESAPARPFGERARRVGHALRKALAERNTWLGLTFALLGGAGFKSLEVVIGPFLVDRGYDKDAVGWFAAGPMIGATLAGAVLGGFFADRWHRKRFVGTALTCVAVSVAAVAVGDLASASAGTPALLVLLTGTAFFIGVFTAASYALFMDATNPFIAATQFSAFMGATNGCEAWSTYAMGRIAATRGYAPAMLSLAAASLLALPALAAMRTREGGPARREQEA